MFLTSEESVSNLENGMMIRTIFVVAVCVLGFVNIVSADIFGDVGNEFTIDFVDISGDSNPTSGYGIVNDDYRMGTYEITNDQWNKFTSINGAPTGNPSSAYNESATWTGTNVPTNELSWYEGAQFVNYLNTSTGNQAAYKFSGSTMSAWDVLDIGYDASNPFRNSNSKYFMPTEDEWVKAAYWNGTDLQDYANALSSDLVSGSPDPAKWNYSPTAGSEPWNVGSGSEELNGTFDMMGNVWEWMESPYSSGDYLSGSNRGVRGGSYYSYDGNLGSSDRGVYNPGEEDSSLGFRVASVVPEPCSLALLGLGGLALRKRRA
jgi:formylglycine-generating enzyme required for sulfatase activity